MPILASYKEWVLIAAVDRLLHDHGIGPTTKFKACTLQRADHSKPENFMKFDGGDVLAISNDGEYLTNLRSLLSFDQGLEQQVSQSQVGKAVVNINSVFDGKMISWARLIRTAISESQDVSVQFREDIGQVERAYGVCCVW